jgi:hypothetical protein
MAFITVKDIAEAGYAGLYLKGTSITPNLITRPAESVVPNGKGLSVQYKRPSSPTARVRTDQTADITVDSVNEGSVTLDLNRNVYAAMEVTDEQWLGSLDDAMAQIVVPMLNSVSDSIETYFAQELVRGFAPFVSGTQGTNPSTLAHLAAAEKVIFDNKGLRPGLVGLFNSTAYSSLTQVNQNISSDYQGDAAMMALRENRINPLAGIQVFRSNGCAANLDRGAIAGTVLVKGVQTAGATSLIMDGLTNATGVMKKGTRFALTTGDTTIYTVTADTAAVGSEINVPITPALAANTTNDDPVVFQTAVTSCPIFAPQSVVGGVLAGPPASDAGIITADNMSLQLIELARGKNLKKIWVLQGYIGLSVLEPKFGVICQG